MLLGFFRGDTPDTCLVHEWERIYRSSPDIVVLGISVSGPGGGSDFRQRTHVTFPLLFDRNYQFAKPHAPADYPITAVVNEAGKVTYASHRHESSASVIHSLRRRVNVERPPG
jgi:peroxiredoxin